MELNLKSFKALSSTTRVRMLRALQQRRMTTTELATMLGVHVTTAKEHMEVLQDAGFIVKEEDGHKWKYYALTNDGKSIVTPYPKEFKLALFLLLLLAGTGLLGLSLSNVRSAGGVESIAVTTEAKAAPDVGPALGGAEMKPASVETLTQKGEGTFINATNISAGR